MSILKPNEVGIDFFKFSEISNIEEYYDFLFDSEKERADQLKLKQVFAQFVITRGRLRRSLAQQLSCTPQELIIESGEKGKPYLKNFDYQFNVSHTQGAAIIALSPTIQLGVDIENLNREVDIVGVAKQLFTEQEQNFIFNANDKKQAFFYVWTRKEALSKAFGLGIYSDIKLVSVVEQDRIVMETQECFIHNLKLTEDYCVAMASKNPTEKLIFLSEFFLV